MNLLSKFLVFLFSLVAGANAQTWESTDLQDYHNAVVMVELYYKGTDTLAGYGSGVVVEKEKDYSTSDYYYGYVLTAGHVVSDHLGKLRTDLDIRLRFLNGKITKGNYVLNVNEKWTKDHQFSNDCAALYSLIPSTVKPIVVSDEMPRIEEFVEICGYGAGDFRHFIGKFSGCCEKAGGQTYFTWVIQGDSGGPVLFKGKLIGIVSGGLVWITTKYVGNSGDTVSITSPARACSLNAIKEVLNSVRNRKNKNQSTTKVIL